jgi:pre-mRNA cleavage complex 2 protein Pcf11
LPECKSKAQNDKERAAAAVQEKETQLKDAFVVIPLGEEAKTATCPICKEVLNPEFNEDEEEWIYKNAVEVNGKVSPLLEYLCLNLIFLIQIFHSTCHADTAALPNVLISRIKNKLESRSRSNTPEADSRRAGSRSPNLKRKSREEDESDSNTGFKREDGTPPLKKLAISSQ